jgi:hypothetical protein
VFDRTSELAPGTQLRAVEEEDLQNCSSVRGQYETYALEGTNIGYRRHGHSQYRKYRIAPRIPQRPIQLCRKQREDCSGDIPCQTLPRQRRRCKRAVDVREVREHSSVDDEDPPHEDDDADGKTDPVHGCEGAPGVDEHAHGEDDGGGAGRVETGFGTSFGDAFTVESFLIEGGSEAEKGPDAARLMRMKSSSMDDRLTKETGIAVQPRWSQSYEAPQESEILSWGEEFRLCPNDCNS